MNKSPLHLDEITMMTSNDEDEMQCVTPPAIWTEMKNGDGPSLNLEKINARNTPTLLINDIRIFTDGS